jgi:uncharacterized protein (DUF3820 family)
MIKTSEKTNELFAAFVKMQAELSGVKKTANNPFFKSKYATLEDTINAAKGPLDNNGLAISQMLSKTAEGDTSLVTLLVHTSGQFISSETILPVSKKNDAQAAGSSITYFRRYAWQAALGMSVEDDDGNSASKHVNAAKKAFGGNKQYEQSGASVDEFIIPVGKSKGTKLTDMPLDQAEAFLNWIDGQGNVTGPLARTKEMLELYISANSNS